MLYKGPGGIPSFFKSFPVIKGFMCLKWVIKNDIDYFTFFFLEAAIKNRTSSNLIFDSFLYKLLFVIFLHGQEIIDFLLQFFFLYKVYL